MTNQLPLLVSTYKFSTTLEENRKDPPRSWPLEIFFSRTFKEANFTGFRESEEFPRGAIFIFMLVFILVHACIVTLVGYTLRVRRKASLI